MRAAWLLSCALAIVLAAATAPAAGAQTPLTPTQFAALDGVYTTQIALEGKTSAQDYAAARSACRSLDSSDALLNPFRKTCTAALSVSKAVDAFAACKTALGCLRTARAARIELTELLGLMRTMNRAIDAARLVPACRSELRASKADLRYFDRTRAFLRLFQEVSLTGSPRLARRLDREAAALDRISDKQPSTARERKRFRAACAPAPA